MPKVGIVMGSDSDLKVMSKAAAMLEKLGIDYEDYLSAQRTRCFLRLGEIRRRKRN